MPAARAPQPKPRSILHAPGWTADVRANLERLIRRGAGRKLPVVFDFDNTLVCGDVGEATLAMLVKRRRLRPDTVAALTPAFRTAAGRRVSPGRLPDLTAYYEALLEGGGHGAADPNPLTNGYTWAVEVMAGLSPREVVRATEAVSALAREGACRCLEVTAGRTAYLLPWFYPEMVELIAALIRHEFQVWVVSASNVWSVRWMVLHELNPRLARLGCPTGLAAERVIGVAPLLFDERGRLLKDRVLVQSDPAYGRLEPGKLAGLRLTRRLDLPVPVYAGKVACVWEALGSRPYLAAGDSPGDVPMLAFAEHRLWIARIEKPGYSATLLSRMSVASPGQLLIQPVRVTENPGFLAGGG